MKKKIFTNKDGVEAIKQYIDDTHEGKLFFNAKMVTHFCTKLYPELDKKEIHSVIKYCLFLSSITISNIIKPPI